MGQCVTEEGREVCVEVTEAETSKPHSSVMTLGCCLAFTSQGTV